MRTLIAMCGSPFIICTVIPTCLSLISSSLISVPPPPRIWRCHYSVTSFGSSTPSSLLRALKVASLPAACEVWPNKTCICLCFKTLFGRFGRLEWRGYRLQKLSFFRIILTAFYHTVVCRNCVCITGHLVCEELLFWFLEFTLYEHLNLSELTDFLSWFIGNFHCAY